MVDSIGTGPVTSGDRQVAPVTRVSQTSAVKHVQRIKEALANGTFPISPATLADRMIALRYDWMSRDQA